MSFLCDRSITFNQQIYVIALCLPPVNSEINVLFSSTKKSTKLEKWQCWEYLTGALPWTRKLYAIGITLLISWATPTMCTDCVNLCTEIKIKERQLILSENHEIYFYISMFLYSWDGKSVIVLVSVKRRQLSHKRSEKSNFLITCWAISNQTLKLLSKSKRDCPLL